MEPVGHSYGTILRISNLICGKSRQSYRHLETSLSAKRMKKENPFFMRFVSFLVIVAVSPGCVTKELNQRLSGQFKSVADQTREFDRLINQSGSYPLAWKDALKLLNERNQNLIRSRERSEEILREREEQWKTWVPRPSVFANLDSSLAELGDLSFSDLNASVVAPLTIPNPFTERAKAFENALSYRESEDSLELTYRRNVVSLYQIYSRMARIEEALANIKDANVDSVSGAYSRWESRSASEDSLDSLQSQLVQLLNMPGSKPLPVASTRPNVDYQNKFHKFEPGRNYAKLAVRLSAYRIEGALLREKGVKLRKWPSISLSGSTPPLYDTQGNQDFADSESIFLFGGLSKSYDLVGADVDSVKTAEQNTEYVKDNLRLQLDRDMRDWNRLQNQYSKLIVKKRIAEERLSKIRKGNSVTSPLIELAMIRSTSSSLVQYEQLKEQLDLEIWTWDDQAWK